MKSRLVKKIRGRKNYLIYSLCFLYIIMLFDFVSSPAFASERDKIVWNKRYETESYIFGKEPVAFLTEHVDILPKGKALDLATGEGRNAVFLAKKGFDTDCCDISEAAIEKARMLAKESGVTIRAFVADLENFQLPKNTYDVITCFYYLQRDLIPQIKKALKPGGMVVYETFTVENLERGFTGPKNRNYLLKPNELLQFFRDLKIVYYRELVLKNEKAVASLIAEKQNQ